jgi:hypothetical protein
MGDAGPIATAGPSRMDLASDKYRAIIKLSNGFAILGIGFAGTQNAGLQKNIGKEC